MFCNRLKWHRFLTLQTSNMYADKEIIKYRRKILVLYFFLKFKIFAVQTILEIYSILAKFNNLLSAKNFDTFLSTVNFQSQILIFLLKKLIIKHSQHSESIFIWQNNFNVSSSNVFNDLGWSRARNIQSSDRRRGLCYSLKMISSFFCLSIYFFSDVRKNFFKKHHKNNSSAFNTLFNLQTREFFSFDFFLHLLRLSLQFSFLSIVCLCFFTSFFHSFLEDHLFMSHVCL